MSFVAALAGTRQPRARFAFANASALAVGGTGFCLIACLAMLGGCQSLTGLYDRSPKPSARIMDAGLRGLSLQGASIMFDVEVSNPYPAGLPLRELSYALTSDGKKLLDGRVQQNGTIPARGRQVIQLPANLQFATLPDALKSVKPGSVIPYTADFSIGVDAPVLGPLAIALTHRGELPIPAVPNVELVSFDLGKLALDETRATARLRWKNTNQFPLDLAKLNIRLALGELEIARTGLTDAIHLKPGESATLLMPLSISPRAIGAGLVNLLRGNEIAYQLSGSLEANSRFGPLTLPFNRIGNTPVKH